MIVRTLYTLVLILLILCALADALIFLQESELQALEGSNVSICVEIELPGELLADIEITFVTLSGGAGAGENVFQLLGNIMMKQLLCSICTTLTNMSHFRF